MTEPSEYRQTRCRHGWVVTENCLDCKEIKELELEISNLKEEIVMLKRDLLLLAEKGV